MSVSSDQERWDSRYRAKLDEGVGTSAPAAWLVEHADLLQPPPGATALDIACGLGRNALYLARLGFAVDAVDVSAVAVEHVARAAASEGLAIRAIRADLSVDPLPGAGYDAIVVTFFLDRRLLGPLRDALAPGGLLLYETFLADDEAEFGPKDPARVLVPGELRAAFAGLEIVDAREAAREPGGRATARLVARRPLAAPGERGLA